MEEVTIHVVGPIVVGLVIGIFEAYFVYEDENMTSGKDFLADMWHGLVFSVLGVLAATNVPFIMMNWIPEGFHGFLMVDAAGISLIACIAITLFMMVKMVASHKIKGVRGGGFTEKFWHKAVIAGAVGFSPYYIFAILPMIEPVTSIFPSWMPF